MVNPRASQASAALAELLQCLPEGGRILVDNWPYLVVVGWPFVKENGKSGMQTRAVVWNGSLTIALDEQTHQVFVVHQERRGPDGIETTIEFPGGGIDSGAEPLQTAKSELIEEAGVTGNDEDWISLYPKEGVSPISGLVWTQQHAFLLLKGRIVGMPSGEDQILKVVTQPLSKLIEMDDKNEFDIDPLGGYGLRRAESWLRRNRPELLT